MTHLLQTPQAFMAGVEITGRTANYLLRSAYLSAPARVVAAQVYNTRLDVLEAAELDAKAALR